MSEKKADEWLTISEIVDAARAKLTKHLWDHSCAGVENETTLRRNRSAFEHIAFQPRALKGVLSPCIPINGVMRVLQEIGAGLINQPICESVLSIVLSGHRDPFLIDAVTAVRSGLAISLASITFRL